MKIKRVTGGTFMVAIPCRIRNSEGMTKESEILVEVEADSTLAATATVQRALHLVLFAEMNREAGDVDRRGVHLGLPLRRLTQDERSVVDAATASSNVIDGACAFDGRNVFRRASPAA